MCLREFQSRISGYSARVGDARITDPVSMEGLKLSIPVELEVESLDGKISRKINEFTTDRVTGSLRIIDWGKESGKWKYLQVIQFPKQSSARPIVEIPIGVDRLDLHYSHEDVQGLP